MKQNSSKNVKQNSSKKKKTADRSNRTFILSLLVVFSMAICAVFSSTLYTMAFQKHLWSGHTALDPQISNAVEVVFTPGLRGAITDRNGSVIAQQSTAYNLYANFDLRTPEEVKADEAAIDQQRQTSIQNAIAAGREEQFSGALQTQDESYVGAYVTDAKSFAASLKKVLGDSIDEETIYKKVQAVLDKNNRLNEEPSDTEYKTASIALGTGTVRISQQDKEKLEAEKIPGLYIEETVRRTYPTTPYASTMLGYADYNDNTNVLSGKLGLEKTLDSYLSAKNGVRQYLKDSSGKMMQDSETVLSLPENGDNVSLTIDSSLQKTVEKQMQKVMEENQAELAWCLVMNPETGEILAWASYPAYDQNTHLVIPSSTDKISQQAMEVGSVFKPLVYASALDAGVFPHNTYYRAYAFNYTEDPDTGKIVRLSLDEPSSYPVIYDPMQHDYGTLTFEDGLALSSNVAICLLLANYLDKDMFLSYMDKFGLFQTVNVSYLHDMPGFQVTDDATSYLSTGFGQGSQVTPLQLAQAYTAIFNDGNMMKPYIVQSITDGDTGEVLQQFEPQVDSTPISEEAASQTREMMRHVLDEGMMGERFALDGVDMCLKTGTGQVYDAQRLIETGGASAYSATNFTSSVMAAAPADDPKVMVFWGMLSPNYLNYSAEPFKTIMTNALRTVGVNVNESSSYLVNEDGTIQEGWLSETMPSLVNHSLDYANSKLDTDALDTVVLSNGSTVLRQYPPAGTEIHSGSLVLLYTGSEGLVMPDMTGWTRKEVTAFSEMTGVSITITGQGNVQAQSVPPDTALDASSHIEVTLEKLT